MLILPPAIVDIALGVFFLVMILSRRWLAARGFTIGPWALVLIGAAVGFLTGIVVSTGPISVPIFTAYGLVKGSFIATSPPRPRPRLRSTSARLNPSTVPSENPG